MRKLCSVTPSDAAVFGGSGIERNFIVSEKVAGVGGRESDFSGGGEEEGGGAGVYQEHYRDVGTWQPRV